MSSLDQIAERTEHEFQHDEERQRLLEDKERLDFLETVMMDRMVTVSGNCITKQAQPHGQAYVHLNGIGYMPAAPTFREAIDNARAAYQST